MRKAQQGVSVIGVLLAVILFAIVAKAALAIWPTYWDDRVINKEIEDVLKNNPITMKSFEFESKMDQQLSMNNIRDLKIKDITQVQNAGGLEVKKKYEVRKPFLLNIDLVLTFEKDFDQRFVQSQSK
ncbi:DUF4845 domain-containing protein [Acinetobacter sp. CAAS 2-6]|uniref:DUF4845 domain-containing protein n=1 Tax=Acinetobacter sp. CAAS 2-6 TaxID=3016358 RepID=UPI002DD624AF|nr:DUF4845 domain-containing protein [Acinetobacter sp. CAAS 2-6]